MSKEMPSFNDLQWAFVFLAQHPYIEDVSPADMEFYIKATNIREHFRTVWPTISNQEKRG